MSMIILSVAAIISLYALSRLAKKDAAKKELVPIRVSPKENQRRR
jgi:hypothetical protein